MHTSYNSTTITILS